MYKKILLPYLICNMLLAMGCSFNSTNKMNNTFDIANIEIEKVELAIIEDNKDNPAQNIIEENEDNTNQKQEPEIEYEYYDNLRNHTNTYKSCNLICRIDKTKKYLFRGLCLCSIGFESYCAYNFHKYSYNIYGPKTEKYYNSFEECYMDNLELPCYIDNYKKEKYNLWILLFTINSIILIAIVFSLLSKKCRIT